MGRRLLGSAVIGTAAVILLAGCSSGSGITNQQMPLPPTPTDGNSRSVPSPGPGMEWVAWHLQKSAPASSTITVFFDNDMAPDVGCTMAQASAVHETANAVYIGLESTIPPQGIACGNPGFHIPFTIHLHAPLGGRRIIDLANQSSQ